MNCGKTFPSVSKHLVSTVIDETAIDYSAWIPATGMDSIKAVIKRFSVTTAGTAPTYNVKLAIQTALVRPDKPGNWQTIGTSVAGAGETAMGVIDVSQITAGQAWVRFGIVY